MTDQDLIQLLLEKPPGEFTLEELDALRQRWTQSPEIRQALIEHLHLESQLKGALGQIDLDIDQILKRADDERRRMPQSRSTLWRWSAVLVLLLAVGIGASFFTTRKLPHRELAEGKPQLPNPSHDSSWAAPLEAIEEPADALVAMGDLALPTAAAASSKEAPIPVRPEPLQPETNEPWSKALARAVAPWPTNSDKFTRDFRASGHDELSEVEAKRWFTQVAGQPFNWGQDVYGQQQRRAARFHGLARLRSPWPDDALLRMTPFDTTDLTIYLWRGPSGIALRYYTRREPYTWAAFEVLRENSSPKPIRWGLLTTDNGAYVRAGTGTFDLRYQDGGITLAKGGVPLMTAPLSAAPDEVFVEGQFRLRGISIHRTAPLPSLPENPHPIVVNGLPASQPWAASAEAPAEIVSNVDGSVEFRVDSRDKTGMVVLPLARRGLYEVIARVDAADPGTGLFLGDLDGRPVHRLGFFKDAATGRTTIGILRPGEVRDQANFDFNSFPPPYHTPAQWIKIVAGLGTLQVLVSGDGRQWGHLTEDPARDLPGAVGSIGLFGLQGPQPRVLKLARLDVRSLSGITSLADPTLVASAPLFTADDWKDPIRWTHRAVDTIPPGVELPHWITACIVSSLSQGPPREFALNSLKRLLAVSIQSNLGAAEQLQLLDDISLLCDSWEEASAHLVADHYDVVAEQLASDGDLHPVTRIRSAVFRSPMWTVSKLRFAWERQVSQDLIRAVYRNDWPDAMRTGQSALFWNAGVHPDWVPVERAEVVARQARWIKSIAVEHAPQLDDGQAGVIPGSWRHPLALQWNKEAYNVRAELQAALAGQTYEDACRVVMSINANDGPGLLPDMEDRQLFVSLPTAVAAAMQVHPDFAKLMAEKFGPLGVIRVRQAIQSGDVRGIQSATLQFFGTEAAAEAHQWLGDRDLSAGRFPSAEEHFLLGLAHCLPRQREGLQSRLQLAMALNGKPVSETSVTVNSIELSDSKISSSELESLAKSLTARPSAASRFQHPAIAAAPPLNPLAYRAEQRASFDGHPGLNPDRYEYRFGDPFGKQLAAVADAQRIYVSNRFQLNAYALPGGQQQWAQGLGSEQGEAHGMPFTPMSPLIAGNRLFVRRLGKGGAELACLNSEDGNVVWTQRPNLQVLSDPVFWNGSLFALTLAKVDDDLIQVEGTRFDVESGAATSSQPLFRLRDSSERSNAAQLTVSGRLAVCSLAGISACFDGSGEIHWLRRHLWLPKQVDDLAEDFRVAPPLIRNDRVVLSVPGVRAVSCVDLETGRQIWLRPLSTLRGIIAMEGSKVLIDTGNGLTALSAEDGEILWTRPMETRLEAFHADDRHLVVAQRTVIAPNKTQASLVWLSLDSGKEIAQSEVGGFERPEAQLGPILHAAGKWWSFGGQGWKETKRELLELTTASSTPIPGPIANSPTGGIAEVPVSQLIDLALVMPGWRPETNYGPRLQIASGDVRGEKSVIATKLDPNTEVRLLQLIDIPKDRKTLLKLRYGNAADKRWTLAVRVGGKDVFEQVVEESGSNNGWREAVVDLTPYSGKQIPVQLIQTLPPQQQPTEALWKCAAVQFE